jgi:hypothetical protein
MPGNRSLAETRRLFRIPLVVGSSKENYVTVSVIRA